MNEELSYISVDEIEGDTVSAETEDGAIVEISLEQFSTHPKEGMCYFLDENGLYRPDEDETDRRRAQNISLFRDLMGE